MRLSGLTGYRLVSEPATHVRRDCRRHRREIALQPPQIVDRVDVVGAADEPRFDPQPLGGAQRVGQDAAGPPLDLLEQTVVHLRHPDQIVAAIVCRPQDDAAAGLQRVARVDEVPRAQQRDVRADEHRPAVAARPEQFLEGRTHPLPQIAVALTYARKCDGSVTAAISASAPAGVKKRTASTAPARAAAPTTSSVSASSAARSAARRAGDRCGASRVFPAADGARAITPTAHRSFAARQSAGASRAATGAGDARRLRAQRIRAPRRTATTAP